VSTAKKDSSEEKEMKKRAHSYPPHTWKKLSPEKLLIRLAK
jgi:hypothetical protein